MAPRFSAFARALGCAAVLAAGGCKFAPTVASGSLACDNQRCPDGLVCSAAGRCCLPGDGRPICVAPGRTTLGPSGSDAGEDASGAGGLDAGAGDAAATGAGRWPRLVEGTVRLISRDTSCTAARGSAGNDRWCAFYRGRELWVLDVTRAAALGSARCDGTDVGCLRLSENAFRADINAGSFYSTTSTSYFRGDVLIYYADARQGANEVFRGGVHAWRPGWSAGQRLTSANGEYCVPSQLDASSVLCADNRDVDDFLDLLAGRLVGQGSALAKIERVSSDPPSAFLVTSSGDYVLYSWAPLDQRPTLYAVAVGQVASPGSRVLLASDAELVAQGANGTKAYFLRAESAGADADAGADAGAAARILMRADVPTGNNVIEVARGNFDRVRYALTRGGVELGLTTLENLDDQDVGDLRLFWDAANPTRSIFVGRAWRPGLDFSADGRLLSLVAPPTASGNPYERRMFDTVTEKSCTLGITDRVSDPIERFSADGRLVFWGKGAADGDRPAVWASTSADCAPVRQIGLDVNALSVLDKQGLVFRAGPAERGALQFLTMDEAFATAEPQLVQEGVDRFIAVLPGTPTSTVVFTSSVPGREGLYAARLPF